MMQRLFTKHLFYVLALFVSLWCCIIYLSHFMNTSSIIDDEIDFYKTVLGANKMYQHFYDKRQPARSFIIDYERDVFLKDGKVFQYISGSVHYNRIPKDYWKDRLVKVKAAGLDAVQFYIPWNYHEFEEGKFVFSDNRDVVEFISIAASLDLLVILRIGPYICGEWDFGGLPAWLLAKNSSIVLRSSDSQFIDAVRKWFDVLLPKLRPLLYNNGGSVIMVQLENEYGSYYTCDRAYLDSLYQMARSHLGNNAILFTTDGYTTKYLQCGAMDDRTFATVDFGTRGAMMPNKTFQDLRRFRKNGPLVNSEFYVGWLDHWGLPHAHVNISSIVNGLQSLIEYSASVSVNLYMFHGGTNFAYWNGANSPPYLPQPTSYDYDAPISEAGDITRKYVSLREAIIKMKGIKPIPLPKNNTKRAYGIVRLKKKASILNLMKYFKKTSHSIYPISMEKFGQFQGYSLYSTEIHHIQANSGLLNLTRVGDQAYVFFGPNWRYVGSVSRPNATLIVEKSAADTVLVIVVDNQGHVNFRKDMMGDLKGIIGNVSIDAVILKNFNMSAVELDDINNDVMTDNSPSMPKQSTVHSGQLILSENPEDTFINLLDFSKGQLYINGYNLGRYWPTAGPQVTLYVPKYYLKKGANQIRVFELEGYNCRAHSCRVQFIDYPIINKKTVSQYNFTLI